MLYRDTASGQTFFSPVTIHSLYHDTPITRLPLVTIQFLYRGTSPPAASPRSSVTIQRLYCDLLTSPAASDHDTIHCIATRSPILPSLRSCHDTPHPGCPYYDTIAAPATIQSLYCDTAFLLGQASLPASVSQYKWLYHDPMPMLKMGSSPANLCCTFSFFFFVFFHTYFFFLISANGKHPKKIYIHFFLLIL